MIESKRDRVNGSVRNPSLLAVFIIAMALIFAAALPQVSLAQGYDGQTLLVGEGTLISPDDAWTYYTGQVQGVASVEHTFHRDYEVGEVARALTGTVQDTDDFEQGIDYIYEYVRNNVQMTWLFGLSKGARGALIDDYGTSFDQAHLMVELLREAGYTASYVYGELSLDADEFVSWTGIADYDAATSMLANGGFPAVVSGTSGSPLTGVVMSHIWVRVELPITGGTADFDPSFKPQTHIASIDLQEVTLFDRSSFVSGALAGIQTNSNGFSGISGNVDSSLNSAASLVAQKINDEYGGADIEDVVGGSQIIFDDRDDYVIPAGTTPTLPESTDYAERDTWAKDIPNVFRTRVVFDLSAGNVSGGAPIGLSYADEIYGYPLMLKQDPRPNGGSNQTGLSIVLGIHGMPETTDENSGNVLVSWLWGTSTELGSGAISILFDHPYASDNGNYMDRSMSHRYDLRFDSAIILTFGDVGPGFRQRLQSAFDGDATGNRMPTIVCPTESCEGISGPSGWGFNTRTNQTIAGEFATQVSQMGRILEGITNTEFQNHHTAGVVSSIVGFTNGPGTGAITGVSQRMSVLASVSASGRGNVAAERGLDRSAFLRTYTSVFSTLEGSVTQQINDSHIRISAGDRIDSAGTGSFSVVTAANLAQATLPVFTAGLITDYVNAGYTVIAAQSDDLGPGDDYGPPAYYQPSGYNLERGGVFMAYRDDDTGFADVVNRWGYNDKGGGSDGEEAPWQVLTPSAEFLEDQFNDRAQSFSVDQQTGALTYTPPPDITVGTAGLAFQRTYQSGGGRSPGLAPGWSHSFDSNVSRGASGSEVFGESFALRASTSIAVLYAMTEVSRDAGLLPQERLLLPLMGRYLADEIRRNTITVTGGHSSEMFVNVHGLGWTAPETSNSAIVSVQGGYGTTNERDYPAPHVLAGTWNNDPQLPWDSKTRVNYTNLGAITVRSADGSTRRFDHWNRWEPAFPSVEGREAHGWHLSQVTSPSGSVIDLTYHSNSQRLMCVSNNFGDTIQFSAGSYNDDAAFVNPEYLISDVAQVSSCGGTVERRTVMFNYDALSTGRLLDERGGGAVVLASVDRYNIDGNGNDYLEGTVRYVYDEAHPEVELGFYESWEPGLYYRTNSPHLTAIYLPTQPNIPFIRIGYDPRGMVRTVTDANRNTTEYFLSRFRSEVRAPSVAPGIPGPIATTYFDEHGRAFQSIDNIGRTTSVTFDEFGRTLSQRTPSSMTTELLAAETVTSYEYDEFHNVTKTTVTPYVGPALITEATYYPPLGSNNIHGLVQTSTDVRGNVTDYTYNNTTGQPTSATGPAPDVSSPRPVTTYTYTTKDRLDDELGVSLPETVTAPDGIVSKTVYNSDGSVYFTSADVNGVNLITEFMYDATGNMTDVIDPMGNLFHAEYDGLRRITELTGPLNMLTTWDYNVDGFITAVNRATNAAGTEFQTTSYEYQLTGRVDRVINPEGNATTYFYDEMNRPVRVMDAEGRIVHTTYDDAGRVVEERRAFGTPAQMLYRRAEYDMANNLTLVEDANGNQTTYDYDALSRMELVTFPDASTEAMTYSAVGDLITRIDRGGDRFTFTYNAIGQEKTKTVENADDGAPGVYTDARLTTLTYDIMGRQTHVLESYDADGAGAGAATITGEISYYFDTLGRNSSVTNELDALTMGYGYDDNSNRNTVTWPDGYVATYNHDALNRVTDVVGNEGGVGDVDQTLATYAYDVLSRRTQLTYGNGAAMNYCYENNSVSPVETCAPDTPADNIHLAQITHSFTDATNVDFDYAYNDTGQLTLETYSNADYLWNTGLEDSVTDYTVNELNQYTATTETENLPDPAPDVVTTRSITYDLNGNLTLDGSNTYTYDAENRLTDVTMADATHTWTGTVAFEYDPHGRLERKSNTPTGQAAAMTFFLLDGEYQVSEYNEDIATGTKTLTHRYIYGPGTDEPIVMVDYTDAVDTEKHSWYHQDRRGSVVALSDEAGVVADIYTYDPYGVPDTWTGNRIRFTGRWIDAETGLYYYRARFYSATLGRFMQTDPIGYGDNMNMYAYVGGDPMNNSDPTGMCTGSHICNPDGTTAMTGGNTTADAPDPRADDGDDSQSDSQESNPISSQGPGLHGDTATSREAYGNEIRQQQHSEIDRLEEEFGREGQAGILIDAARDLVDENADHFIETGEMMSNIDAAGIIARATIPDLLNAAGLGALRWILRRTTCCFVAGTLVETENGLRPIEEIVVGDLVLSQSEESGQLMLKPVLELIRRLDRIIWEVESRNALGEIELFRTTDDHPWLVVDIGWQSTEELQVGMIVSTADGSGAEVISVTQTQDTELTYNIEVADFHTYFVGQSRLLVHNACAPKPGNMRRVRSDSRANQVSREHGFRDAHDAKAGYGRGIDIYQDRATGQYYIWDGRPLSEMIPL